MISEFKVSRKYTVITRKYSIVRLKFMFRCETTKALNDSVAKITKIKQNIKDKVIKLHKATNTREMQDILDITDRVLKNIQALEDD